MFLKEENPQLFFYIAKEYHHLFPKEHFSSFLINKLTDEQLAKITSLEIKAEALAECNIKSLKGIEKLPNLTSFTLRGQTENQNTKAFMRLQKIANEGSYSISDYKSKQDFLNQNSKYYVDCYQASQIIDLSPLQQCSNLKKLDLAEQHSLGEIDLSFWPNLIDLNMKNCRQLYKVKGLDKLRAVKSPTERTEDFDASQLTLNFTGCDFLRHVDGFDQYVDSAVDFINYEYPMQLPTTAFCNLHRQYPDAMYRLVTEQQWGEKAVFWTECCNKFKYLSSSAKMNMAKKRADDIIRTVCAGQENSPIGQVAQIYRWICDNVTYDHDGLRISEAETKPMPDLEEKSEPIFINNYKSNKIRTLHAALFEKTAVCVGVSNLFNFMVSDLGYLTSRVFCSSESPDNPILTIANHQMSSVSIDNNPYYCDPTWDLGKSQSSYFCLTGEEINKDHSFTVASAEDNRDAKSLQEILRNAGCLQTQQPAANPFTIVPTHNQ